MENLNVQYMWPATWKKPAIFGSKGAISSNNVYATMSGLEILEKGGNAIDAAVAVSLTLAVVEPHHSGLGGGCFSLLYLNDGETIEAIDARGIAPQNAKKDLFLKNGIVQNSWKDVGGQSVAVPGLYRALDVMLKKYGTMTLEEVSKSAISHARNGFGVSYTGSITMPDDSVQRKIKLSKDFVKLYLKNDKSYYKFGETIKNEELANTIESVAKNGVDSFYQGQFAEIIVKEINNRGGIFTLEDLKNYQPKFRTPIKSSYRGHEILTFSPPSGGCALVEMLNILENFDLKSLGHNSADSIHLISEAMKLGFADRSVAMGDPDFVNVNVEKLISKEFAKLRSQLINMKIASEYAAASEIEAKNYPGNTSHFSIMDSYGNVVSQTQTIRDWFGSGIIAKGLGFVLNNAMSDFSALEGAVTSQGLTYGSANSIEGGKTPLSSMCPTIVLKNGFPFLAIGAAGGPRIITGTLQGIINAVDYEMTPEELVRMPYITSLTKEQGLELEAGISIDTINKLEEKGHKINYTPKHEVLICMLNSVMKIENDFYPNATGRVDGCGGVVTAENSILLDGIMKV